MIFPTSKPTPTKLNEVILFDLFCYQGSEKESDKVTEWKFDLI